MTTPRLILALFLSLLVIAPGANNTPVLSAVGKILFPGTSPNASISNSSGAISVASGGTNQHVTLLPSGTGQIVADGTNAIYLSRSYAAQAGLQGARANGTMGSPTAVSAGDWLAQFSALGYTGSAYSGRRAGMNAFANENWSGTNQGAYLTLETTAAAATSPAERVRVTAAGMSVLTGADPAYAVDVTGQVNASTGYRVGAVNGHTAVLTVRNAAGTGTCTITVVGGIITGSTC